MRRLLRRLLHPPIGVMVCVALSLFLVAINKPPRNDRDWYPYLAKTTHVDVAADSFGVTPVTDWRYDAKDATSKAYTEAGYKYTQLRKVWFVLEPQPGSKLAAHTFLLFEFDDNQLLGVTIEARRERHEDYSAWNGLFNAFELSYLWGTSHDLLARRAVMLNHQVFMCPVRVNDPGERDLLQRLLRRTAFLERNPRYYNTLTSNCTNELAKATKLKWDASFFLTGTADEHLFKLGVLPGPDFQTAEKRAEIADFVKANNGAKDFDAALLAELRRRWGGAAN